MSRSFERFRPHPWHGLAAGPEPPALVTAYVEITPFDGVKYEVDKASGYLRVDRPQRTSALPPALYGFVPRTYCATGVAALMDGATHGDGDPLDVCVLSERPIARADVIMTARVIGDSCHGSSPRTWASTFSTIGAVSNGSSVGGSTSRIVSSGTATPGVRWPNVHTFTVVPGGSSASSFANASTAAGYSATLAGSFGSRPMLPEQSSTTATAPVPNP